MTFQKMRRIAVSGAAAVMLLAATAPLHVADAQAQQLPDVVSVFEAQKASVVSIQTEVVSRSLFFGAGPQQGQGSGFVVDADGYILTNNHVIDGAQKITVNFENGASYPAKLVGTDPNIDIALLKIEADKRLPVVSLGSSETLKVGQWVVAIGNPYGLDYSVTAGIISAKGRNIGAGPYDDFIQTDASINPGNSGGPLFDLQGRVVGVNTAIIRDGQGIGFAVPIDMVKRVVPQLKTKGYVVRGYIGAAPQPLDDDLAASFGVTKNSGALLGSLESNGPAAKAGARPGDIVTSFNGKAVRTVQDLLLAVADATPGRAAEMRVVRNGQEQPLKVVVGERPAVRRATNAPQKRVESSTALGIQVRSLDPALAQRLGVSDLAGVVVEGVAPRSAAAQALRPGDVVVEVDGQAVNTPAEFDRALKGVKSGVVRMLLVREGRTTFVAFRPR